MSELFDTDNNIPVIAEIQQKYGSNLERMTKLQQLVLLAGLTLKSNPIQNDSSIQEIRDITERLQQEITKENEEEFIALTRVLANNLTIRPIDYYVDINIPVIADIKEEYGSNLERMPEQDKIHLANGLLFYVYEKFLAEEISEKVRELEERIRQEISDKKVIKELIKVFANSLNQECKYTLKEIVDKMIREDLKN